MSEESLTRTFSALADPTRRAILARLAEGPSTVHELAAPFDISAPAISKHLRVLQRAGLIVQGRQAQWRPCRLVAKPLREVATWTERYRVFWEGSLDQLDDYLQELQGKPTSGASRGTRRSAQPPGRRSAAHQRSGSKSDPRKKGTNQ